MTDTTVCVCHFDRQVRSKCKEGEGVFVGGRWNGLLADAVFFDFPV